jgi:hypothetical protein
VHSPGCRGYRYMRLLLLLGTGFDMYCLNIRKLNRRAIIKTLSTGLIGLSSEIQDVCSIAIYPDTCTHGSEGASENLLDIKHVFKNVRLSEYLMFDTENCVKFHHIRSSLNVRCIEEV